MRNSRYLFLSLLAGACGVDPAIAPPPEAIAPAAQEIQEIIRPRTIDAPQLRDPRDSQVRTIVDRTITFGAKNGRVPDLQGHTQLFFGPASFTSPSVTTPGTASYDQAPVLDPFSNIPPATFGTGAYDVTVAAIQYAATTAESMAGVFPDDTGTDYLVLSVYTEMIDPATGIDTGTVVHAIVLASDFAVGSTVNFDGVDRLGFFATGDVNAPDPSVVGVAATGSITFTAGSLTIGDLITASVAGDFGEIAWTPTAPPTGGSITPGMYTLSYDPQQYVQCDGTLAGQEVAFAAIDLATLSFVNGTVDVQASATGFTIDGAPITSGYGGAAPLSLDTFPDAPPGLVGGSANFSPQPAGPLATALQGTYLVLDGDSATATLIAGYTGAGYLTADQLGYCEVGFSLELTP